MGDSNQKTLESYGTTIDAYIEGTAHVVSGAAKDWIDAAIADLPEAPRVLELGSAFGRDASYMAALGIEAECTDAVPGFVDHLKAKGFDARIFNVLTDKLDVRYDLILANAVLLHFTLPEFRTVLTKLHAALKPGGRLAFSLKAGQGEEWSDAKIGAPRFFRYWQEDQVAAELEAAGFGVRQIDLAHTDRKHGDWLFVIASP